MSDVDRYLELRDRIIEPVMQKLKFGYEAQGYKCEIDYSKCIKDITQDTREGLKVVRSFDGQISLTRKNIENGILVTATVYLDKDIVGLTRTRPRSLDGSTYFKLDEITSDIIENKIRNIIDPIGSK